MKLVVVDLDYTLLDCNASIHFGKFLLQKKIVPLHIFCIIACMYGFVYFRLIPLKILFYFADHFVFSKITKNSFDELITEWLSNITEHVRTDILEQIQKYKQTEQSLVWLLSSSPYKIVEPLAAKLGFTFCSASRNEYEQNAVSVYEKKRWIKYLSQKCTIATDDIILFSDSIHDIPIFNSVGTAICVYPSIFLSYIAKRNGWHIWRG